MERIAFIIESTGERLRALLNPDHIEVRRTAGVRRRRSVGGSLTRTGRNDDPLLYTGGGVTQLELKLLFDVTLGGSTVQTGNVRDLTSPLWDLAENQGERDRYGRPPVVRFVWGKSWNFPGIVSGVAERLEYFDTHGAPRRSWLSLRLIRVTEDEAGDAGPQVPALPDELPESLAEMSSPEESRAHQVLGAGEAAAQSACGERLDVIAGRYYGDPGYWRLLAAFNDVGDPACLEPGSVIQIPQLRILERIA